MSRKGVKTDDNFRGSMLDMTIRERHEARERAEREGREIPYSQQVAERERAYTLAGESERREAWREHHHVMSRVHARLAEEHHQKAQALENGH